MSFTVFYAAYTLCEIPSNLMLARVGARLWIARIMITWGLASAATMFAIGMWSLYARLMGCLMKMGSRRMTVSLMSSLSSKSMVGLIRFIGAMRMR